MKYLVIIVVSLASGFFGGYMLTRPSLEKPLNPTVIVRQSPAAAISTSKDTDPVQMSLMTYEQVDSAARIFDKLKLAHELADQSDIAALQTYIRKAAASQDPLYSYNLVSVFLEKYTSLDARGAITFVEETQSLSNPQFVTHIMTSWIREDPEAAMDYFNSLTNDYFKNQLARSFMRDPTLASLGIMNEIEAALGVRDGNLSAMMQLNQLSPADALEEALGLTDQNRMRAVQTALIRWLREDPEATISRIQSHPVTEERHQMLQAILHEYANIDEDGAFALARTSLTDNVRLEQQMLSMLGQRNPKRTLPLVEDFISRTGNANPLNGIISSWIQKEPTEALAYIETLDEQQRSTLYQSAAYSYVNSHPQEAFDWLLRQSERYPQMVENTIGNSINHNTIEMAERIIGRVTNPRIRSRLLTGIGSYKATQNSDQALSWLEGYRRDPAYAAAVQTVISSMSHQNPKGAAAAIESHLTEDYSTPIVSQIASNWYRASPTEAMSWLRGLPDGDGKVSALTNIVSSVAHQDVDAAVELLDAIPEGRRREDAKRNIAFAQLNRNPGNVETVLRDLNITGRQAEQLRDFAKQRNQTRIGGFPN